MACRYITNCCSVVRLVAPIMLRYWRTCAGASMADLWSAFSEDSARSQSWFRFAEPIPPAFGSIISCF